MNYEYNYCRLMLWHQYRLVFLDWAAPSWQSEMVPCIIQSNRLWMQSNSLSLIPLCAIDDHVIEWLNICKFVIWKINRLGMSIYEHLKGSRLKTNPTELTLISMQCFRSFFSVEDSLPILIVSIRFDEWLDPLQSDDPLSNCIPLKKISTSSERNLPLWIGFSSNF